MISISFFLFTWIWLRTARVVLLVPFSRDAEDVPLDRRVVLPKVNAHLDLVTGVAGVLVDVLQVDLQRRKTLQLSRQTHTHSIALIMRLKRALQTSSVRDGL